MNTILPRCAVCDRLLLGYAEMDLWGNVYCPKHRQDHPPCSACGRLVSERLTQGGVTYPDGRVVCNLCRRTAVDTKAQAIPLVKGVIHWLHVRGVQFERLRLQVILGDVGMVAGRTGHPGGPVDPYQGMTMGSIHQKSETRAGREVRWVDGITLLSGLPQVLFEGVVAHELGHAWLYLARVDHLEPWAEEGFCNLLSYILYRNRPSEEDAHWAKVLEQNPDPIYGEGFRRVRALFKRRGLLESLRYVFREKSFPPESALP